jgi:D-inositol-3-phosphate glycosyltransferase
MRLLYSFPHALGAAGIGSTAYHEVQGAIREGLEVSVFCTSLARPIDGAREIVTTLELRGRRLPHRALGVERAYRYHDRRVAYALRRRADIDLVHSWPKASLATAAAAGRLGIPTVREAPNTHTGHAFEVVTRELRSLGLDPVSGHSHTYDADALAREEAEFRAADALLVPSEQVRATFVERGYAEERLLLHRYGFDPEVFFPPSARAPSVSGLQALFMGRCEPRKGLHYALRAWVDSGAADRGRFVVCGEFVPGYREKLAPWIDHPSVELRGFVIDPAGVMRESDVLVLPAVEEGSAVVTYEAQGSGCVLVVSDAAGARCEHLRQGLVHRAGDVETLTEHLRLLDTDPGLLARLRDETLAGRAELTWEAAGRRLVELYASVVDRGPRFRSGDPLNRPSPKPGARASDA